MESLISQIPHGGIIAAIVIVIVGSCAGFYFLNGYTGKASKRLIEILQETVGELEKKVNKQDNDIKDLTARVEKFSNENRLLTEVLQGRDKETQEFYRSAFESMLMTKETNTIVKEVAIGIKTQNENMSKLIDLMGKQIEAGKDAGHNIVEAAKIPTV